MFPVREADSGEGEYRERLANVGLLLAALGMAIGLTVTFLVAGNR